jgi:hypothetical protein
MTGNERPPVTRREFLEKASLPAAEQVASFGTTSLRAFTSSAGRSYSSSARARLTASSNSPTNDGAWVER